LTLTEIEQLLQEITGSVLSGNSEQARQKSYLSITRGAKANDVIDAVIEAVNILLDLNEVGGLDQLKITNAEGAMSSSLQTLEETLAASESRFDVKAAVGPVGLELGHLLATVIAASLRSAGFHTATLGKTKTALELFRNSEELGADLVLPLLPREDAEKQLTSLKDEIERGGFANKFMVIPVAPGVGQSVTMPLHAATNADEAISKAVEWALRNTSTD
jgi:methanogenic corrinoid protein MtbC1